MSEVSFSHRRPIPNYPESRVFLQDVNPESENRVNEIGAESQNSEVRVQFADEVPSDNSPQELAPLDEAEADEDENRNKRFLFGFGGGAGGSTGSGNFLFDIIRVSRVPIPQRSFIASPTKRIRSPFSHSLFFLFLSPLLLPSFTAMSPYEYCVCGNRGKSTNKRAKGINGTS